MATAQIGSYGLWLVAGDQTGNVRARIHLYDAKGNDMGLLAFVEEATPPPATKGGAPVGYYPIARLADMVDLLRDESPVFLVTDGADAFAIATQAEKVGEGEAGGGKAMPFVLPLR